MQVDPSASSSQSDDREGFTPPAPSSEGRAHSTRNIILFAVLVLVIVLPIRIFIAKPFIVSGASMFPSFNTWHYLIIDQLTYRFEKPERGDVVVFRFPQNPSRFFIKRVIGLPGETVQIRGTDITIVNTAHPEGVVLAEPYVDPDYQKESNITVELGDDEYFVMGDNRSASADSRYWGPLEFDRIVGRAYLRLFPFTQLDVLPAEAHYDIDGFTSKQE